MPKLSEFIVGIIFISFIITVVSLWMTEMNDNYGVAYNDSNLEEYNQLNSMSNLSKELRDSSNIQERAGIIDIIGSYITGGYNALKLTATSYNTYERMSNQALQDANLGETGDYLRISIAAALIIIIFLGILIAAILKWYV